MKRLMVAAAIAAMSAGLFAAEGDGAPKADGAAEAQAVEAAPARRARHAGAPFDRAKFEERMKKRHEERRAKVAEIIKSAGVAEDKVAATVDEIDKLYARRPPQRPERPPRRRPPAAPAQQ